MGYDCTLHVIREKLVRDRFVPLLLGRLKKKSKFDRLTDASGLWKGVRDALAGDDASAAAKLVGQLALAYCASELPYHYERGFCLSRWPDNPETPEEVPAKFNGSPEDLFASVIEVHPHLRNKFPREIESNGCTGIFVPADRISELLEWVIGRVGSYPKSRQRLFDGLILVLKEAKERGLGYWEGTETPVPIKTLRPATPTPRSGVEVFESLIEDAQSFDNHASGDPPPDRSIPDFQFGQPTIARRHPAHRIFYDLERDRLLVARISSWPGGSRRLCLADSRGSHPDGRPERQAPDAHHHRRDWLGHAGAMTAPLIRHVGLTDG